MVMYQWTPLEASGIVVVVVYVIVVVYGFVVVIL